MNLVFNWHGVCEFVGWTFSRRFAMTPLKTFAVACAVAATSFFGSTNTADAQLAYYPYYNNYSYGYPYGYGVRNLSYYVTNPNGSSVGYSITAPGIYGGYGLGYGGYGYGYGYQPYAYPTPAFGPGSYTYMYPGVFYSPGSYRFFQTY
jgi:hypothetical protein